MPHPGDIFGKESPGENLPFPDGNLTVVEILAYAPHWMKSINVINRIVSNGGSPLHMASIIVAHRTLPLPGSSESLRNSILKTLSNNMRRAGYDGWQVRLHEDYSDRLPTVDEAVLHVGDFLTTHVTHPTSKSKAADTGIPFKNLAARIKMHPSGDDALDLTRCVKYALLHPDETWIFPKDFATLVNHLGGPAEVTPAHLDREVFDRYCPASTSTPKTNTPITPRQRRRARKRTREGAQDNEDTYIITPQSRVRSSMKPANRRKSGRLAGKATVSMREYDSDVTDIDSPYTTPSKKRKVSRIPATPGSPDDSDFIEDKSEVDEDFAEEDIVPDFEDIFSPSAAKSGRVAARKAREMIYDMSTETQRNIVHLKRQKSFTPSRASTPVPQRLPNPVPKLAYVPEENIDPQLMDLARNYDRHQVTYLKPPLVSANRLKIDEHTIYLYSTEGATTMEERWASALSSTRFNGPRTSAPFRELYRLTDPLPTDTSDWAENIRWAKQQYTMFGSITWLEYGYHLEQITEHRREAHWVSEETIMADM